jgi:VCBS repeat-containing protein
LTGDLDGNELVTYTPNENFNGSDSFTFTVNDGEFTSSAATVSITIREENDPPNAVDDGPFPLDEGGTIDGTINVLGNDTDPDQDTLTATLVTPPDNGSVDLNPDGTFVYTHDGSETLVDSFTYEASDGSESDTATVSFTINPVNDAPLFIGVLPPGLSTPEDTTLTIPVSALDIDDPDSDPSTFVLTLDAPLPDANYILAGQASITPAENFNGDLSVAATVSDGEDDSAPFLIPVTVAPVNDLPVLEAEIGPQTAIESSLFELDTFGNFSDADGDTLTFSATGLPVSGRIAIDPVSGVISGTPTVDDARDNAPYVVTVTATDPDGAFVSDEFDLTVSALDRANIGLTIGVTPESGLPNDQLGG